MYTKIMYYAVCAVGYAVAGTLFWRARRNAKVVRIRKKPLDLVKDYMVKDVDIYEVEQLFAKAGIGTNLMQYQIVRFGFAAIMFLLMIVSAIVSGVPIPIGKVVMLLVLFIFTAPQDKILGFKSPFSIVMAGRIKSNQEKSSVELYRAICQLKNLAITRAERPPGSAFILEQLKKFTNKIRPVFNQMQSLWALGQRDQACEYFAKAIGTPEAESFAAILRKIDSMNPIELKSQMILFQEVIRGQRETDRASQNHRKGLMVHAVVVVSVVGIFGNFMILGVAIDMLNNLRQMGG